MTGLEPLNVKLLAGQNSVALPQGGGKNQLAFAGYDRLHAGKMLSYSTSVNPFES